MYFSVRSKLRLFGERITLSRITKLYFVFSVIHCIVQVALQIRAFTLNAASADLLAEVLRKGNGYEKGFELFDGRLLRVCSMVPNSFNVASCPVVWDGTTASDNYWLTAPPPDVEKDDLLKKHEDYSEVNGTDKVYLTEIGPHRDAALLRVSCIHSLNYPHEILRNTKREDIVFITFQFWVLGMSIVALLNESIPHLFASLLTHLVATAWAGFQISHTAMFRKEFRRLTVEGACAPVNLLPNYWGPRRLAELSGLVLNVVAVLISIFLTQKLVKAFGWQTFKRVGASRAVRRIYMNVLMLSIAIQLSAFFMCTAVALWIDQLWNGAVGSLATMSAVPKVSLIITLILLVPWLTMGWFAVRRELKTPMTIFLALCITYLCGWSLMFLSDTFRWTFVRWRLFSFITSASVLLAIFSFILGIVCRLNFGKGLPQYLKGEESLGEKDSIPRSPDTEKVAFPTNERHISTLAESPPSEVEAPPQTGYYPLPQLQGTPTVTVPSSLHTREPSIGSHIPLRQDSQKSNGSARYSFRSQSTDGVARASRWIIE